jgi:acetylornithine deacetylase
MNWTFFKELLSIDSTSGKEREVAEWLLTQLEAPVVEPMEVGDGTLNLFLKWGTPKVVFCTHMDTVPPYIEPGFPGGMCLTETSLRDPSHSQRAKARLWAPPSYAAEGGHSFREAHASREDEQEEEVKFTGRGSCDAKGQLFAMYTACKELEASGCTDFGLLLLAGEETGSWGAKAFSKTGFQAPFLIVGEPTENKMVSASKGTKSYDLTFRGEAFHSGYPQYGVSAVDLFNTFYNQLKAKDFGEDPVLGATTWNVGLVHSDNPQNILSPELSCRLYFRTTFVSDQPVQDWMQAVVTPNLTVTARGGDAPARYVTLPGFESAPVAFGSDAPHLTGFGHKIICGPGTIRVAHRPDEHVLVRDLETAVAQYVKMYHALLCGGK